MTTIYSNEANTVRVLAAGEGELFGNFAGIKGANGVCNGRYLLLTPDARFYFDMKMDALELARFMAAQERFKAAKEAGLNDETAELVATRKLTLEAALGDMDLDAESEVVNEYGCPVDPEEGEEEQDWSDAGGEDDNTPPLEVLMAGGWASWECQNEKNAWLDNQF